MFCGVSCRRALPFVALLVFALSWIGRAQAAGLITRPGQHPRYGVELEPLFVLGAARPPNSIRNTTGIGLGVRASIPVAPTGFIPKLNDSVAVTFGGEWVFYDRQASEGRCTEFDSAPNGTRVCTEIDGGLGSANYLYLPVGMQWNFWLHEKFSAFGEPGLVLYLRNDPLESVFSAAPLFQLGGRWHFMKDTQLVLRLGYPSVTLGVSWLL